MTRRWIDTHKPAAPARVHLVLAALMWSCVGLTLLGLGITWSWPEHGATTLWLLAIAAAGGVIKARYVLDRAARRIITRIEARGDGRCLGGFLSPKSWALVAVMIGAGRLIRTGILARHAVGLLYVLVGCALLISSRLIWIAWRRGGGRRVPAAGG